MALADISMQREKGEKRGNVVERKEMFPLE